MSNYTNLNCIRNFSINEDCCQSELVEANELEISGNLSVEGNTTIGGTLDVAGTSVTIGNGLFTNTGELRIHSNENIVKVPPIPNDNPASIFISAQATGVGANSTNVEIVAPNQVQIATGKLPGQQAFGDDLVVIQDGGTGRKVGFFGNTGSTRADPIPDSQGSTLQNAAAINAVIAALRAYGLVYVLP